MKVLSDQILVEPWYDADRIGLIWLPDSAKNSQPQQGEVIAAGPLSGVANGQHVMFHPWRGQYHIIDGRELLLLHRKDLSAVVHWHNGEPNLWPLRDHVMVDPDWADKYQQPSKTIFVPDSVLEQNQPVLRGQVLAMGEDVIYTRERGFAIGDSILIAPGEGSEIGWGYDRKVYYFVKPHHILARLDYASNHSGQRNDLANGGLLVAPSERQ